LNVASALRSDKTIGRTGGGGVEFATAMQPELGELREKVAKSQKHVQ
jgi:hypothetical protein